MGGVGKMKPYHVEIEKEKVFGSLGYSIVYTIKVFKERISEPIMEYKTSNEDEAFRVFTFILELLEWINPDVVENK